ncbi:sigma-70 family RNA polymerase sigma factor [Paenibacillus sp. Marseille-P2973]|uniref:RNA polymerase sigma factor n=1 Tax=unclassified Paenibacillus TaxID=185978 RepID=UPI001B38AA8E|nr:sigma-70 family RNA polymerase sigma factor [Paenibacillus sp. Marseille-P2973]
MNDREMFETYKEQVFQLCYYMMQNRSDAEDICQEVFVKAILADRTQIRDLRPWLLRIASNECSKVLKRRNSGWTKEMFAYLMNRPQVVNPVEEDYDRKEIANEFNEMISRLPEKIRIVVTLRFVHEMTVPEIAGVIEVPEGTVKSRLNKGMRLLRDRNEHELKNRMSNKGDEWKWKGFLKVK